VGKKKPTIVLACPSELHTPPPKARRPLGLPPSRIIRLDKKATQTKGQGNCCYGWIEFCGGGRPLLVDEQAIVADVPRHITSRGLAATLAAMWLDDGLMEHASVASFERSAIELMALGAPAELIDGCYQAEADEVAHAAACFALAARHGWQRNDPAPMTTPPPRAADLARMAVDVLIEGCVGETVAALCAERALAQCCDEQATTALTMIARDETAHAALAYRTLYWLWSRGGARVGAAVMKKAAELRQECIDVTPRPQPGLTQAQRAELCSWGQLNATQRQSARIDAWEGIIDPLLQQLQDALPSRVVESLPQGRPAHRPS